MNQPGSMKSTQGCRDGLQSIPSFGKAQRGICQGCGEISRVLLKENQLLDPGACHSGLESCREDLSHCYPGFSGGPDRIEFSQEASGAEESILKDVSGDSPAQALFPDDAAGLSCFEDRMGSPPLDGGGGR